MDIGSIMYPVISIGGLGLLFGVGLGYAGIKFEVEADPKVPLVREALPGANCGGCGLAGCDAFADAVVKGTAPVNGCPVGGAYVSQKIANIMGVTVSTEVRKVAFVKCKGNCSVASNKYKYNGMEDCNVAVQLAGAGAKSCQFGCMGLGSCVKVCAFDAIHVVDGVSVVDPEKCTSCGKCLKACPKRMIKMVPENKNVRVSCNSYDNGKVVKSHCSVGCIGCKLCQKACEFDAITVQSFLATVDYKKCTKCGKCVEKCPTKAIAAL